MTKSYLLFLTAIAPYAFGQLPQPPGIAWQQAGAFSVQAGSAGGMIRMSGAGILNPETVAGSPFSGKEESRSLQILGDGTRIERTDDNMFYRDSQGRTRLETGPAGSVRVVIQDPVTGFIAILDTADKTAEKLPAPPTPVATLAARAQKGRVVTQEFRTASPVSVGGSAAFTQSAGIPAIGVGAQLVTGPVTAKIENAATGSKPVVEDLGTQNVNGVSATGHRTTLTVATGEIGNDRPIRVVSETWYSSDLQMLVKSSNADARFGDTSYELMNINRAEPDPALFQIPSDYTVSPSKTIMFSTGGPKE
jgi:hypothetical protein